MDILTQAKQEKIRRLCKEDPIFFIDNFVKTFDPRKLSTGESATIPFKLYGYQKEFIKLLHSGLLTQFDIVVDKSRDMGATWLEIAFDVWAWLFHNGFQALWGGKKEDDVDDRTPSTLFGKADIIIQNLPEWMIPNGFNDKSRTFMKLINPENGNTIIGESANQQFSRSGRYTKIFMDEFAFWEYGDRAWTASSDSSPHRVLVSTPNGQGNTFADIRFGKGATHFEMHWRLHPDKGNDSHFDEETGIWRSPWYDKEVARRLTASDSSLKNIKQELDINYIQSGDPVFDGRHLKKYTMHLEHPHPFDNYAIGVDFSQGMEGNDNQSFDILSKATGMQVFHWQGKLPVDKLAEMIVEYGKYYNDAMIGIERNNGGQELLNRVKDTGYKNLYFEKRYNRWTNQRTLNLGWYTDGSTKSMMILDMQAALVNGECLLTNSNTINEMMIYQVQQSERGNTYKYNAPKGKKDDAVMSLCIAWQVLKDVRKADTLVDVKKKTEKKQHNNKENVKQYLSNACAY